VLLLQGGRDAIVNVGGIRAWFGRLASSDQTLKIYPDYAHILEFEADREMYVRDLLAWLRSRGDSTRRSEKALSQSV
jgi:alpha-beta hydrolase superfamily lysophospholipase